MVSNPSCVAVAADMSIETSEYVQTYALEINVEADQGFGKLGSRANRLRRQP